MSQNQVEIIIAAKDQASQQIQQLNQQLGQVDKAAKGAGQGLASAGAQSLSTTRQFSALSSSTRFAAASVLTELNPALGLAVTRMSSLSTVAGTTGSLLKGTLVVGGIALVATALGSWIRRTNEQIEAQQKLNRQVASFDVAGIQGSIASLSAEIDLAIAKQQTFFGVVLPFWAEVAKSILGTSTSLDLLKQRLEATREAFEKIRPKQFQAELAEEQAQREKLLQTIHQQTVTTSENIEEIWRAGAALEEGIDREAKFQARRLEITQKGAIEKARAEGLGQAEIERLELLHAQRRENLIIQFVTRKVEIVRQTNERVKAIVDQAEKEAEAKAEEVARRAGERIDKTFDAIKKQQERVERIMTSLGNAAAEALFDGLIGRSRSLGEAFKSFFEGLARGIFRDTLVQAFGGKGQGLSLQDLLSLGGGGRPFARVALGAAIPGTEGIDVATRAADFDPGLVGAEEAVPGASVAGTSASASFLGGLAGVGIGALGILGASQAQDPLTGALSGGLGGLGVGLGLAQLGLAAGAVLGPIGLVAGLAFGVFSGASGRRKQKREEARRRRAEAQIQAITETTSLEDLELALLELGTLEPEAQAALRQHAAPLVVERERRRIQEARSLEDIGTILANRLSPDLPGALELTREAEQRRLEILGGLEAIEAIGIEEQLAGGIRRRTIVGAGAFGLARARGTEGELVLSREGIRRRR